MWFVVTHTVLFKSAYSINFHTKNICNDFHNWLHFPYLQYSCKFYCIAHDVHIKAREQRWRLRVSFVYIHMYICSYVCILYTNTHQYARTCIYSINAFLLEYDCNSIIVHTWLAVGCSAGGALADKVLEWARVVRFRRCEAVKAMHVSKCTTSKCFYPAASHWNVLNIIKEYINSLFLWRRLCLE